jgi:hypothetical protein
MRLERDREAHVESKLAMRYYRSKASSRSVISHSQFPDLPMHTNVIGVSGAKAAKSNVKSPVADTLVMPIAFVTVVGVTVSVR